MFLRSKAREIAAALDPLFQRSQSATFCAAVNHIRDVTIGHPRSRLGGVALTYRIRLPILGHDLLHRVSVDRDVARLVVLSARQVERQNAIAAFGLDLVGVDVDRQRHCAVELSAPALAPMNACFANTFMGG